MIPTIPLRPDRTQWLNDIAHTEWTLEEIAGGEPSKHLTSCAIISIIYECTIEPLSQKHLILRTV